jgi:hypothetical protein
MNKLTKIPSLKVIDDQHAADVLRSLVKDADDGFRRIVRCGIFIEWLAATLPWGQLMKWQEHYCPDVPLRSMYNWRNVAKNLCEWAKLEFATVANLGVPAEKFIDLPLDQLPKKLQPAREKIDEAMSQCDSPKQLFLFLGFKQGEIGENGQLKVKHGRLKGSKGLTKEQRAAAAEREEQERLDNLAESAQEAAELLIQNSDAKNFGQLPFSDRAKLHEACEIFCGFNKRLNDAAKGGAK